MSPQTTHAGLPVDERSANPTVVIVGRPNVGKSTLVNRIVGRRAAVVEEKPGVTRDRLELDAEWSGQKFTIVDTGGWLGSGDSLDAKVSAQAERAIQAADLVLHIVDVAVGVTSEDDDVAKLLRRCGRPVLVVANKVDNEKREVDVWDFVSLGLGDPWAVSALHGRGTGDLLDEVIRRLPEAAELPVRSTRSADDVSDDGSFASEVGDGSIDDGDEETPVERRSRPVGITAELSSEARDIEEEFSFDGTDDGQGDLEELDYPGGDDFDDNELEDGADGEESDSFLGGEWEDSSGDYPERFAPFDSDDCLRVALIGRPNVGKSTLFNRLIGEERSVVHDMPGTTRDAIDTVVETPEGLVRFVDTAGMRRKSRTESGTEYFAMIRALDALDKSDIVLLVVDATEGITHQDQRLAERVGVAGSAVLIVLNKWELVSTEDRPYVLEDVEDRMAFLGDAPILKISARTGMGVHRLLPAMRSTIDAYHRRIPTGELNRALRAMQAAHAAPGSRIKYGVQGGIDPPTFTLFATRRLAPTYVRYVERKLREQFEIGPTPIKIRVRLRG